MIASSSSSADSSSAEPSTASDRHLWPLIVLIAAIPFGVAAQSILAGVVVIALLAKARSSQFTNLKPGVVLATALSLALIGAIILATVLNPKNTDGGHLVYFLGFAPWCLLPLLAGLQFGELTDNELRRFYNILVVVCGFWGLICLSQAIWGWRIAGISIESDVLRPRGLYSHPLTLAYCAILLWPLACSRLLADARSKASWVLFLSIGVILITTHSRTVQCASFALLTWELFVGMKGRARIVAFLALSAVTVAIAFTDNPISEKFILTFSKEGYDRSTDYPDDRLAFWDAHRLMIEERPLLGHGHGLGTAYRTPYYEALGLGDLRNKYEAHNTYLQTWAEGGLLGLSLFLGWAASMIALARKVPWPARRILLQTIGLWLVASVTQNAFQDSEPRLVLTIWAICVVLWPSRGRSHQS